MPDAVNTAIHTDNAARRERSPNLAVSDLFWSGGIFAAALLLRVPFRSSIAYHWDGLQFALGIGHYDIAASQPHAPGYFLYVMLGRLLNHWIGDPHASLVWISVVAGALLPAIAYLLAISWFGRSTGLVTAAILTTSPLCWFHSEVALTTMVDASLNTATVLACWLAIVRGGDWRSLAGMALTFALVAANRQQTAVILLPVWLYTFWRFREDRLKKFFAAASMTAFVCLLWFAPMVATTGGLGIYLELLAAKKRVLDQYSSLAGLQPLLFNVKQVILACWTGLLIGAVWAPIELLRWTVFVAKSAKLQFLRDHSEAIWMILLWLVPQICFGLFIYTLAPGYVLSYFPALALIAAAAIALAPRTIRSFALVSILVLNTYVFFNAPVPTILPLTLESLTAQQQGLRRCFESIRSRYKPEQTVICHQGEFFHWGFRHFMYYMPEYRNALLNTDASLLGRRKHQQWLAQGRRTEFVDRVQFQPHDVVLLVVPPGERTSLFSPHFDVRAARLVPDTEGTVYELAER